MWMLYCVLCSIYRSPERCPATASAFSLTATATRITTGRSSLASGGALCECKRAPHRAHLLYAVCLVIPSLFASILGDSIFGYYTSIIFPSIDYSSTMNNFHSLHLLIRFSLYLASGLTIRIYVSMVFIYIAIL